MSSLATRKGRFKTLPAKKRRIRLHIANVADGKPAWIVGEKDDETLYSEVKFEGTFKTVIEEGTPDDCGYTGKPITAWIETQGQIGVR